ncbi:MAG: transglutaminase domain-containing protein, partial [Bacteroidota bacterium]
ALFLNPYDYESRDALLNLNNENVSAFSDLAEPDYYQVYADSPNGEQYPDYHSLLLRYDVQQVVHEGGASEERVAILLKTLDSEGVADWKSYNIPVYSNQQGFVEKIEVLSPDGSRHEGTRSGADVVFDNLQAGDGILIVYRIRNYRYGKLSNKFWKGHYLRLSMPILRSTYSLVVPEGTDFTYRVTGPTEMKLEPDVSKMGGRELYVWETKDQDGFQAEANMPNLSDVIPMIQVTNIDDWDFVAQWYRELADGKARVDYVVQQTVDELFAGKEGLSEREEVELIYDFIVNNIRYISVPFLQSNFIPQKASKVLTTRQGDCKDVSVLFVAMCEARGVDANLVLINTRDRARNNLALPGISFNHCIARVELEEKEYYVELTDE